MTTTLDLPFQLGQPQQVRRHHPDAALSAAGSRLRLRLAGRGAGRGPARSARWTRPATSASWRCETRSTVGVLLYDGEELVGAKQNRILNVSVLLARGLRGPHPRLLRRARPLVVAAIGSSGRPGTWPARSCGGTRPRRCAPTRSPGRRAAHGLGGRRRAAGAPGRRTPPPPPTATASRPRRRHRSLARSASRLEPGQCGVVASVAGRGWCLDAVSRPAVFARIYRKLLAGYVYDALERTARRFRRGRGARRSACCARPPGRAWRSASDLRIEGKGVIASGLAVDGELVQISAYGDAS